LRVLQSESRCPRPSLQLPAGGLPEKLRPAKREDVVGPRRVLIPRLQRLSARARPLHDSLSLVLRLASRGRLRRSLRRPRPGDAATCAGVQCLRPVLKEPNAAELDGTATILRGLDQQVLPQRAGVLDFYNPLDAGISQHTDGGIFF